jgi:mRNA interferase RelE/StbE
LAKIAYKSSVARDLKHFDKTRARAMLEQLEDTLSRDPDAGEPLRGEFEGLYKLRIGDYRVIYCRTGDGVLILRIGHRSKVYGG